MSKGNIRIVEKLPTGKLIVEIVQEIKDPKTNEVNNIIKFSIADENGLINIIDLNGALSGIQFFDNYSLTEQGDVIIGVRKTGKEYYDRVLSHFDLSDTQTTTFEVPSGLFNIGPYSRPYYEFIEPTKTVDDIVPQEYSFNYGVINSEGVLVIYPFYDEIEFGNEDTCIVGILKTDDLAFGYVDINTGKAITPVCFEIANKFYNNRAAVKYNRYYGYIDRNKIIINPQKNEEYADGLYPRFFNATDFNNGVAIAGFSLGSHLEEPSYAQLHQNGITAIVPKKSLRLINKKLK